MARGVKTGGRQKGSLNKANAELAKAVAASGETPALYMLRVMRDPTVDHDRRDKMAIAVAPYIHQKLAAMEISGDPENPLELNVNLDTSTRARALAAFVAKTKVDGK